MLATQKADSVIKLNLWRESERKKKRRNQRKTKTKTTTTLDRS